LASSVPYPINDILFRRGVNNIFFLEGKKAEKISPKMNFFLEDSNI